MKQSASPFTAWRGQSILPTSAAKSRRLRLWVTELLSVFTRVCVSLTPLSVLRLSSGSGSSNKITEYFIHIIHNTQKFPSFPRGAHTHTCARAHARTHTHRHPHPQARTHTHTHTQAHTHDVHGKEFPMWQKGGMGRPGWMPTVPVHGQEKPCSRNGTSQAGLTSLRDSPCN